MYQITDHTKRQAEKLGLVVKPSTVKGKKIDVYSGVPSPRHGIKNEKIASIGAKGYSDYGTYLKTDGKAVADERRRLYKLRHTKDTLNEKLARNLLW